MRSRGFTLLELLAAMAIVAVLAAAAIPAWRGMVVKAGRLDATEALMDLASAQERYRFVHGRYCDAAGGAPPAGLGMVKSRRGWYVLEILAADETSFTAEARADKASPQADDVLCRVFSIDETGRRGSAPGSVEECWP